MAEAKELLFGENASQFWSKPEKEQIAALSEMSPKFKSAPPATQKQALQRYRVSAEHLGRVGGTKEPPKTAAREPSVGESFERGINIGNTAMDKFLANTMGLLHLKGPEAYFLGHQKEDEAIVASIPQPQGKAGLVAEAVPAAIGGVAPYLAIPGGSKGMAIAGGIEHADKGVPGVIGGMASGYAAGELGRVTGKAGEKAGQVLSKAGVPEAVTRNVVGPALAGGTAGAYALASGESPDKALADALSMGMISVVQGAAKKAKAPAPKKEVRQLESWPLAPDVYKPKFEPPPTKGEGPVDRAMPVGPPGTGKAQREGRAGAATGRAETGTPTRAWESGREGLGARIAPEETYELPTQAEPVRTKGRAEEPRRGGPPVTEPETVTPGEQYKSVSLPGVPKGSTVIFRGESPNGTIIDLVDSSGRMNQKVLPYTMQGVASRVQKVQAGRETYRGQELERPGPPEAQRLLGPPEMPVGPTGASPLASPEAVAGRRPVRQLGPPETESADVNSQQLAQRTKIPAEVAAQLLKSNTATLMENVDQFTAMRKKLQSAPDGPQKAAALGQINNLLQAHIDVLRIKSGQPPLPPSTTPATTPSQSTPPPTAKSAPTVGTKKEPAQPAAPAPSAQKTEAVATAPNRAELTEASQSILQTAQRAGLERIKVTARNAKGENVFSAEYDTDVPHNVIADPMETLPEVATLEIAPVGNPRGMKAWTKKLTGKPIGRHHPVAK